MTALDDTRHCPMCEDAAEKILELECTICDLSVGIDPTYEAKISELEQRVKVLTDALNEIRTFPRRRMPADIANEALDKTPQQTAAQIERGHIEWMMKLTPAQWFIDATTNDVSTGCYVVAAEEYRRMAVPLYKIPPLPKESNSPETDLDEALRRQ